MWFLFCIFPLIFEIVSAEGRTRRTIKEKSIKEPWRQLQKQECEQKSMKESVEIAFWRPGFNPQHYMASWALPRESLEHHWFWTKNRTKPKRGYERMSQKVKPKEECPKIQVKKIFWVQASDQQDPSERVSSEAQEQASLGTRGQWPSRWRACSADMRVPRLESLHVGAWWPTLNHSHKQA